MVPLAPLALILQFSRAEARHHNLPCLMARRAAALKGHPWRASTTLDATCGGLTSLARRSPQRSPGRSPAAR
jgi:hypothetical protein